MKTITKTILLLVVLFASVFVHSQTVDEIIAKHLDSAGGKDKIIKEIHQEKEQDLIIEELCGRDRGKRTYTVTPSKITSIVNLNKIIHNAELLGYNIKSRGSLGITVTTNNNNNQNIKPKSCVYGCGIQIYWNASVNEYWEVFTKKKHICPNRWNKSSGTTTTTTITKTEE